jgi:hypothetical protein
MGEQARKAALSRFSTAAFVNSWHRVIDRVRSRFTQSRQPTQLALR